MDKPPPKADVFQANRERVAPLLKKLQAEGISHLIDGKTVASISGEIAVGSGICWKRATGKGVPGRKSSRRARCTPWQTR